MLFNLGLSALVLLAPSGDEVVANVRHALITGPAKEVRLEGNADVFNAPAKYVFQFKPDGSFLQDVHGALGGTYGFDGKTLWRRDHTGAPMRLDFADVNETMALSMLLSDHWLDPNSPVTLKGEAGTNPSIHLTFKDSGQEEVVNIDPATWLPTTATFAISEDDRTTVTMSDWREAGGRKVPFRVARKVGALNDTFTVTDTVEPDPSAYAFPAWSPTDTSFDSSKPAEVESKRVVTGHILVHPLVNGKDVGWFILDSGAETMCIDPSIADEVGMPKIGTDNVTGIGGTVTSSFRTGSTFALGGATVRNLVYIELDLKPFGQFMKEKIAGIVGTDFFYRTIVAIDINKAAVKVFDPANYQLAGAKWSQMKFESGNPAVEATCEGDHKGWFRLDTGDPGTVAFHAPFVDKYHLLDKRETTASGSGGVGGTVGARAGQIEWFELGGHRFAKSPAIFSQAKVGSFSDRYLAGNIGQQFMKPFVVVLDFGGSRVGFVPNPDVK